MADTKQVYIDHDVVFEGQIYEAQRDDRGGYLRTEVSVPAHASFGEALAQASPVGDPPHHLAPPAPPQAAPPAAGTDPAVGSGQPTGTIAEPYEEVEKDRLLAEVQARRLDIKGTGANGNILKADMVAALQADDEARAASTQAQG